MGDLKNPRWIILKGFLFLFVGMFAAALLLFEAPHLRVAILMAISIWAFCRFYYFAFYVIEHYVDGQYRFAGLFAFARYMLHRYRTARRSKGTPSDSSLSQ